MEGASLCRRLVSSTDGNRCGIPPPYNPLPPIAFFVKESKGPLTGEAIRTLDLMPSHL
jgi:hypothetical protein